MFISLLKLCGRVTDLIVNEHESQLRFDNGVGHQQILHLLQLLFALLGRRETLTSHWKVLKKFHYTHCRPCKRNRTK